MSLLILAWQNVNNFLKEGVAKCADIRLNAKCSTGQRSKSPFCQVHSHLLECTMRHRTEIQKERNTKHCGNQMEKFIINLYKVKEHVSVSSSVTQMRDL